MVNKYCLFQCVKQACLSLTNPVVGRRRKYLSYKSAHVLQARAGVWASRPWCGICQRKFYLVCMSTVTSTNQSWLYKLRLKSCALKPKLLGKVLMFWLWTGKMGSAEQVTAPGKGSGAATPEERWWQTAERGQGQVPPLTLANAAGNVTAATRPHLCTGSALLPSNSMVGAAEETDGKCLPCLPTWKGLPSVLQWWQQWHKSAALLGRLPARLWINLRLKSLARIDRTFFVFQWNYSTAEQISSWEYRGQFRQYG